MFKNYKYFLALAEELNVSKAAEKLFISHQNLSKYLINLEKETGLSLFDRKPFFALTYAGRLLYATYRQVELLEQNIRTQYEDIKGDNLGELRIGTTEGRFRIIMPDIISAFEEKYPHIHLKVASASSTTLEQMVLDNKLDFIVAGLPFHPNPALKTLTVLEEHLYLVISDNMLKKYFGEDWHKQKETMKNGADLRAFKDVPFALNLSHFNSSIILRRHLDTLGMDVNCVHHSSHPDLHHLMSAKDYAASFCLTMYLKPLFKLNKEYGSILNIVPVKHLTGTNHVAISYAKQHVFSAPAKELLSIVKNKCAEFKELDFY